MSLQDESCETRNTSVTGGTGGLPCKGNAKPFRAGFFGAASASTFQAEKQEPSPTWHPAGGGTRGNHGQDAHATAADAGVTLIFLSATLRAFALPFSSPFPSPALAGYPPETEAILRPPIVARGDAMEALNARSNVGESGLGRKWSQAVSAIPPDGNGPCYKL